MKVICVSNRHKDIEKYEYNPLKNGVFGRFNVSQEHEYPVVVGNEYIILGMIMFKNYLAYLTDDNGLIIAVPCYLFETADSELILNNWYFRVVDKNENLYPFVQAIWGYEELCKDKQAYEKLVVEMDEGCQRIYFRRKNELLRDCLTQI